MDGPIELTTQDFADLKDGIGKGGVAASLSTTAATSCTATTLPRCRFPLRQGLGTTCRVTFNNDLEDDFDHHYAVLCSLMQRRGLRGSVHQRPEIKLCRVVVGSMGRKQRARASSQRSASQ